MIEEFHVCKGPAIACKFDGFFQTRLAGPAANLTDFFKFDGFLQTRFPALPAALQTRLAGIPHCRVTAPCR